VWKFQPHQSVDAGLLTSRSPMPGQLGQQAPGFAFLHNEMIDNLYLVVRQIMGVNAVELDFPEGGSVQDESHELLVLGKQR
jgi:hypothetical protein